MYLFYQLRNTNRVRSWNVILSDTLLLKYSFKISICSESVYINTEVQFFFLNTKRFETDSKIILFGYNIISSVSSRGETAPLRLSIKNQVKNRQRSYLVLWFENFSNVPSFLIVFLSFINLFSPFLFPPFFHPLWPGC